jgi:hypothetical protein
MAKFPSSRFPNMSGLSNGFYIFEMNDALWPNPVNCRSMKVLTGRVT